MGLLNYDFDWSVLWRQPYGVMLLKGLGQDPAQSSSIILTTITDVTGFFTFLGIATLMMGIL